MKAQWAALAARIDALTLRERVMVFAGGIGVITYALYFGVLNPLYDKQKTLRTKISQAQNNIDGLEADLALRARAFSTDPNANNRARLALAKAETETLGANLRGMQKGLVAPDRIVPVIESILRNSRNLRLVSLKKLPVVGFNDALPGSTGQAPVRLDVPPAASERAVLASTKAEMANAAAAAGVQAPGTVAKASDLKMPNGAPLPINLPGLAPAAPSAGQAVQASTGMPPPAPVTTTAPAAAAKPPDLLFRHGVEITLSGSYLDMIAYMEALESLPTQLFWGKAEFEVEKYPNARLTLTLYTLSMDKKWMRL